MRVKGGFRARFNLDGTPNIVRSVGIDGGIPQREALAIGIVSVDLDAAKVRCLLSGFEKLPQQSRKPLYEGTVDIVLTCLANSVETRSTFLAAECFQLFDRRGLPDVIP